MEGVEIETLEIVLRYASALSLTVAALLIFGLLARSRLRPWPAWLYLGVVVAAIAAWRWVVVSLITPEILPRGVPEALAPWVQHINQAFYTLAGVAVAVLSLVSGRSRREL
jgi:hypothetical protein